MGAIIDKHTYIHTYIHAYIQVKHFKSVMGCWPLNRKESRGIQWKSLRDARHPAATRKNRLMRRPEKSVMEKRKQGRFTGGKIVSCLAEMFQNRSLVSAAYLKASFSKMPIPAYSLTASIDKDSLSHYGENVCGKSQQCGSMSSMSSAGQRWKRDHVHVRLSRNFY